MESLLRLFARNGGVILFFVLEVVCFFLIVNYGNNERRNSIFRHTVSLFGGRMMSARQNVAAFYSLRDRVQVLNEENARLRTELLNRQFIRQPYRDTFLLINIDTLKHKIARPQYTFIAAEVVSNSIGSSGNWLVLNRGSRDGITPDCGVVAIDGLVGVVRHVDESFSMAMSLLHSQSRISARLAKSGALGSLIWDGRSSQQMNLVDVPKDVSVAVGDTVVTSGYSTMFPGGMMLGIVSNVHLAQGSNSYLLRVRLQHDMSNTTDVHVIKNIFQTQIDSLIRRIHEQ